MTDFKDFFKIHFGSTLDCAEMVRVAKHVASCPSNDPRVCGQNSRPAQRPKDNAGGAELDLHGHYRHDRLELFAARRLSTPLSAGSFGGKPLPEFPLGGEDSQVVRLHARLLAQVTFHVAAPNVVRLGFGSRHLPFPIAGHFGGQRDLSEFSLL